MSYLMESAAEATRLEVKTDRDATLRQLRLVGLRAGMKALDAGSGTGAVARAMTGLVGAGGTVVSLDRSPERSRAGRSLSSRESAGVRFVVGDLYDPPLRPDSFDLVWCRFVFEYLSDPDKALRALVHAVRPGGKVVVGDLDGNGLFHHPLPPSLGDDLHELVRGLRGRFDPYAGRKIFTRFRAVGLQDIKVHVIPYHLYAGTAEPAELRNWDLKFAALRSAGTAALGPFAYDRLVRSYLDLLRDPDAFTYSVLLLVEGTKGKPTT